MSRSRRAATFAAFCLSPLAFCQSPAATPPAIDKGDTVWVMVSAALVLLMTPGLALFYGGMVRRKNVLSSMMHSFIALGLISVLWLVCGYTLAFGKTGNGLIGGFEFLMGNGVSMKTAYPYNDPVGTIPNGAFMLFQMMFAIITPALISGAIAERMKFSGYVVFTILWSLVVYSPVACWVWNPGGWLFKKGALDFAGGTVVHLASGASAFVACVLLGKRQVLRTGHEAVLPNNLTTTLLGAGLLWFGWIGFNAGSALGAGDLALSAFAATHFAAAAGMLAWLLFEKIRFGKPTALGAASGLVAGLVGITPASGYVTMPSATLIGFIAGAICFFAVSLKSRFGFDDSLDVVGVHGVGGATGALLTGVFATAEINPAVADALKSNGGRGGLILTQLIAIVVVAAFAMIVTAALMKLVEKLVGVRATEDEEIQGLDLALHGESGYNL